VSKCFSLGDISCISARLPLAITAAAAAATGGPILARRYGNYSDSRRASFEPHNGRRIASIRLKNEPQRSTLKHQL